MKTLVIKLVAIFEIICGLAGFVMVLGGFVGIWPYEPIPVLWFGVFPILSLIAGVMLFLNAKYGFQLSVIVLILQIPYIIISGVSLLRVGLAFHTYLTAVWLSRVPGTGPTILGINALATLVLVALFWSRDAMKRDVEKSYPSENPPEPSTNFAE
jgi:hypothetical protein